MHPPPLAAGWVSTYDTAPAVDADDGRVRCEGWL